LKANRLCSFVLAGVILAAGMTGCSGSGASSSGASVNSSSGDSSAATEADKSPVTLNIAWWGSQTRNTYTQKLLDMYHQKYPNISFTGTPSGYDSYEQKLSTQAAGNELPDIMQMDYTFISEFTKNGSLADLSSYVSDKTIDLSNADQSLVDSGKINGKLSAIVIAETAPTVAYNPDVLKDAGVAEPTDGWTWDDLLNDCIAIHKKTQGFGFGTTIPSNSVDWIFNYYLRQYGKSLYDSEGKTLGYSDDKYFIDFINQFKKMQDEKAEPTVDEYTQINARGKEQSLVVQGKAGFMFEWANYPTIVTSANPNLKLVTMPNNSKTIKAMYLKPSMFFSISNNSKHKKESAEFINWFLNDIEANKVINAERGVPISSTIRDEMKTSLTAQNKAEFKYIDEVSKNSSQVSPPDPAGSAEIRTKLNDEFDAVLYGKKTEKQAAADFRKESDEVLSRNS
jgi:multiple sugar transport system substrate-binding protein